MGSKIMHGVHVRILSGFLIFEEWIKHEFRERGLEAQKNGVERKDDIHSLDVSIAADLFEEQILFGRAAN